ncbi:MAG TPA: penicillin-binding protein 2, partial [Xanthobacteraceae bacterium]|nr:penicillin-binding protein 2 [Xanthobacteraceae bacterium]
MPALLSRVRAAAAQARRLIGAFRLSDGRIKRPRLQLVVAVFAIAYAVIGGRLVLFGLQHESHLARRAHSEAVASARPDILDR